MANEKRLIDANALKNKAKYQGHCVRPLVTAYHLCVSVSDIDNAPTVDAVEVVRCKDCVWCEKGKDYVPYCNHPTDGMHDVQMDDFCSYGERKDHEND